MFGHSPGKSTDRWWQQKDKTKSASLRQSRNQIYLLVSFRAWKLKFVQRQTDKDSEREGYVFAYIWSTFIKAAVLKGKNFFQTDKHCWALINTTKRLFKFSSGSSGCKSLLTKITFQCTKQQTFWDKCNCKNPHCLFKCSVFEWKQMDPICILTKELMWHN